MDLAHLGDPWCHSVNTFLSLFLKVFGLQGRLSNTSAGNWFQSPMVLFTKEYFPISVLCFLVLILRTWSTHLRTWSTLYVHDLPGSYKGDNEVSSFRITTPCSLVQSYPCTNLHGDKSCKKEFLNVSQSCARTVKFCSTLSCQLCYVRLFLYKPVA
jgi:hypothetical protein